MSLPIKLTAKLRPLQDQRFLLAVSGGLDSMALLGLFLHFRKNFHFQFAVAHFHHGPGSSQQIDFRNQAKTLVEASCIAHQIPFHCNWSSSVEFEQFLKTFQDELKTEDQCRQARYQYLEQLRQQELSDFLVFAHHRDDLVETRVLKLLRGVGPESLEAMSFQHQYQLRPLLEISRSELEIYMKDQGMEWLEDPSNQSLDPMRNWLRNRWFKDLDQKWPGSFASLGRSLDLLVESTKTSLDLSFYLEEGGVNLSLFLELDLATKRRVLAYFMRQKGLKNYGLSHINEVLKQLDREQKRHMFRLLGRDWIIDAGRMILAE